MTGMEMLVVGGNECVLGKVRHDGYDVVDWIEHVGADNVLKMKLDGVWKAYYGWRWKKMSDISRMSEIESEYQKGGFPFKTVEKASAMSAEDLMEQANEYLQEEESAKMIKEPDFYEGYLCGYKDYEVVVNIDAGKITINREDYNKKEMSDEE